MTEISYDALKSALGKDIGLSELENILFEMGMGLEGHEDDSLSIEITPERLDLLSAQGIARAIKSFEGSSLSILEFLVHHDEQFKLYIDSKVKQVRPYTVCAVIKNLSLDDEKIKQLINIQEKLHQTLGRRRTRGAIGIYPMEKIVWPIRFTAEKPQDFSFVPLGETKSLTGEEILKYHETGKEFAHLLEGKSVYPFFIDGNNQILSLPPIINSETTGRVTEDTKDVFIECSGFELSILNQLLVNLTTMFKDMGGDIYAVEIIDEKEQRNSLTPDLTPREKIIDINNIEKRIGIKLSEQDIETNLLKMMHEVVKKEDSLWTIRSPVLRFDLWHEVDIIDDIARAYGYNNIPLSLPQVQSIGSTLKLSDLNEELSDVMAGLGFLETYTFAITSEKEQLDNMLIPQEKVGFVKIANGMESQGMLRISLLPQQLQSLANNRNRPIPQKIFEGSFVVIPDNSQDVKARNEMHFSALIADKVVTFTDIKQVLDALLRTRGISVEVKSVNHPSFIEGRVGTILYKGSSIGLIGELHPQVLDNFGLQTPVAVFEINLEKIL